MNTWIKIAKIAKVLDKYGFYREADVLDHMVKQAQYSGPQNTMIPLEIQMGIPFQDLEQEYQDVEQKRRTYNPRTREKPYELGDPTDEQEEQGSLTDMNADVGPSSGITRREMDNGAGYRGIDNLSLDTIQKDRNNKNFPTYSP